MNTPATSTQPASMIASLDQHIEVTPGVLGGKPRIAGRRISVQDIVVWHERMGQSADEIAAEYQLELADVYAALAYYYDHRQEVDEALRAGDALAAAMRTSMPSKVHARLHARAS